VFARRAPGLLRPGDVVDAQGRVLGRHGGACGYTVGQRRGLGVPAAEPLYVVRVDPAANVVGVGPREALLRRIVRFGPVHWVGLDPALEPVAGPFGVEARLRHAHVPQPATLSVEADGTGRVALDGPAFAPAPGQALVAYRGDAVLCGGPILGSD
jgi:tRNA-specific 2-thiouridylase